MIDITHETLERLTPKEMDRTQLIYALASHARSDHYKQLLTWPTDHLRSLLEHYREMEKPRPTLFGFPIFKMSEMKDVAALVDNRAKEVFVDNIKKGNLGKIIAEGRIFATADMADFGKDKSAAVIFRNVPDFDKDGNLESFSLEVIKVVRG